MMTKKILEQPHGVGFLLQEKKKRTDLHVQGARPLRTKSGRAALLSLYGCINILVRGGDREGIE